MSHITPLADASGTAGDLTGVHPAMVHTQGFHATTTDTTPMTFATTKVRDKVGENAVATVVLSDHFSLLPPHPFTTIHVSKLAEYLAVRFVRGLDTRV